MERIGIGRAKGTDVTVSFEDVSKYHAYIVRDEERGAWMIVDAASSNGTFVDGRGLVPHEPAALRDNCIVRLGSNPLRFFEPAGLYRALGESLFGNA